MIFFLLLGDGGYLTKVVETLVVCLFSANIINNYIINICYLLAGRSVFGETVPEVLSTALGQRRASGGTQREGTVSPNTDRSRPVNNIFIFFLLRF